MCDNPVMLPSNRQTSDILTKHTVGKLCLNLTYHKSSSDKFERYGSFSEYRESIGLEMSKKNLCCLTERQMELDKNISNLLKQNTK